MSRAEKVEDSKPPRNSNHSRHRVFYGGRGESEGRRWIGFLIFIRFDRTWGRSGGERAGILRRLAQLDEPGGKSRSKFPGSRPGIPDTRPCTGSRGSTHPRGRHLPPATWVHPGVPPRWRSRWPPRCSNHPRVKAWYPVFCCVSQGQGLVSRVLQYFPRSRSGIPCFAVFPGVKVWYPVFCSVSQSTRRDHWST